MTTDPDPRTPDKISDPALDDGDSADWSSEGGATEHGPATDHDDNDASSGDEA